MQSQWELIDAQQEQMKLNVENEVKRQMVDLLGDLSFCELSSDSSAPTSNVSFYLEVFLIMFLSWLIICLCFQKESNYFILIVLNYYFSCMLFVARKKFIWGCYYHFRNIFSFKNYEILVVLLMYNVFFFRTLWELLCFSFFHWTCNELFLFLYYIWKCTYFKLYSF